MIARLKGRLDGVAAFSLFVKGLLEAYWEAYEAVGLSLFSDYYYLREVWTYHQGIVDAILAGDLRVIEAAF